MDISNIIDKIDGAIDSIPDRINDVAYIVMDHFNLVMMIITSIICLFVFIYMLKLINEIVPKDCDNEI